MTRMLAVLLLASTATGADWPTGSREVQTTKPRLGGVRAFAPIPKRYHITNEGGSDGAGLCVDASALAAGMTQGVPGLAKGKESAFWLHCKATPGGSYPEKLVAYVEKTVPGEKYLSVTDATPQVLDKLSRQGLTLCMTMNTGELYNGQPIHHMVNYSHFDSRKNVACIRDNNDTPGVFRWITAEEATRRGVDGGVRWAFVWLRNKARGGAPSYALLMIAAVLVLVALKRRSEFDDLDAEALNA